VAWRIRAAVKQIAEAHPELGRHLRSAVRTGAWCAYRPEVRVEWDVQVSGPHGAAAGGELRVAGSEDAHGRSS
jgi:hypothetical protein